MVLYGLDRTDFRDSGTPQTPAIKEGLKLSKDGIIIPFSAETKQGRDEIWALIDELTGLAATEEA